MKCPKCGEDNVFGALTCVKCGTKLTISCPYCGYENVLGVLACQNCGRFLRRIKEEQKSGENPKV